METITFHEYEMEKHRLKKKEAQQQNKKLKRCEHCGEEQRNVETMQGVIACATCKAEDLDHVPLFGDTPPCGRVSSNGEDPENSDEEEQEEDPENPDEEDQEEPENSDSDEDD